MKELVAKLNELEKVLGEARYAPGRVGATSVRFKVLATVAEHYHLRRRLHFDHPVTVLVYRSSRNGTHIRPPNLMTLEDIEAAYDNPLKFWAMYCCTSREDQLILMPQSLDSLAFWRVTQYPDVGGPLKDLGCQGIYDNVSFPEATEDVAAARLKDPKRQRAPVTEPEW